MTSLVFHAEIREGKLVVSDRKRWHQELSALVGKRVVVTVETEQQTRSREANAYYWKQVVGFFQDVWSKARKEQGIEGYTKEQTHEVLVQVLIGSEDGPLPGTRVRKPTRGMKRSEFYTYVEAARELAWQQYQARIPEPNEGEA
jgi:hypothetical protein